MQRRGFLALLGGGVILAAGGTLGTAATRTPKDAYTPWGTAGAGYTEPRMRALSYAILAPNPHNRQPWLVDLSREDEIHLYADLERLLPHTDPFNRQITIGLGCFLETLRLALAQGGFEVRITPFPEGSSLEALDERPVARVELLASSDVYPDPLFAQVPHRRSIKEPYDLERAVNNATLGALVASGRHGSTIATTNSQEQVERLRQITGDALIVEMTTPHTMQESVDLSRIGASEIDQNPDGIDFGGPLFETLGFAGVMSRENLADPNSMIFKGGLDLVQKNAHSAMAFVWQTTTKNDRPSQIAAGMDWMRLHLKATELGLALHPMSQALQEFPEMATLYEDVHKMLAPEGAQLQMLARLGYADTVPPSPRWPLEAKVIGA